jgi:hypothetical protein
MSALGDIAKIQAAARGLFRDTCQIGVVTLTDSNDPTAQTWTYGAEMLCGFDASASRETVDGAEATITDGIVRIVPGIAVNPGDRIQVNSRNFAELDTPEVYAVVGAPRAGLAATLCKVLRVTGASSL